MSGANKDRALSPWNVRSKLIDGWVEMMQNLDGLYFVTLTHEQQRNRRQWLRIVQRVKKAIDKRLVDSCYILYVFEDNRRGGEHVHMVIALGVGYIQGWNMVKAVVDDCNKDGRNKTEIVDGAGAIVYILKYMFKGGNAKLDDNYGFL